MPPYSMVRCTSETIDPTYRDVYLCGGQYRDTRDTVPGGDINQSGPRRCGNTAVQRIVRTGVTPGVRKNTMGSPDTG